MYVGVYCVFGRSCFGKLIWCLSVYVVDVSCVCLLVVYDAWGFVFSGVSSLCV